jgi:TIR domain
MKIFLSWSGDSSKTVAELLRDWLPTIFPDVTFWISTRDIQAGTRWGTELDQQLESTNFGILCLVPTNVLSPWLIFEAGALSKGVTASRVVPYCVGIAPEDVQGPLSRFQSVSADEVGTRKIVDSINGLLDNKRAETLLNKQFEKWWPDLKRGLEGIPAAPAKGPAQIRVRQILCASTTQFEALGAEKDFEILEKNYPGVVTRIRDIKKPAELREALALQSFDIVHLLAYVEPRTGDILFDDNERLPAGGLLKLLERAKTELLFLATCDSLTLGAILSRSVSVVAASDDVDAEKMIDWEHCFYGFLANGTSLTSAYDVAQATTDLPMRLLIRNDAVFLPGTK